MLKRPAHLTLAALAVIAVAAVVAVAVPTLGSNAAPAVKHDSIATIRQATAKYQDLSVALADGYVPASECTASPAGAMGVHYMKPSLLGQPIDLQHPPILLYLPKGDDAKVLGVEYFKADADQDLATDGDRPSLLGHAFDGPMPGHDPQMPIHYDLHVWTWKHNPAGMFESWNPSVSC